MLMSPSKFSSFPPRLRRKPLAPTLPLPRRRPPPRRGTCRGAGRAASPPNKICIRAEASLPSSGRGASLRVASWRCQGTAREPPWNRWMEPMEIHGWLDGWMVGRKPWEQLTMVGVGESGAWEVDGSLSCV